MSDWLSENKIDSADGLCVCIATDGIDTRAEVLGVGFISGKLPYTSVMIQGADPYRNMEFTSMDPHEYFARAMEENKARKRISDIIAQHRFLVVKDMPFINTFVHKPAMQPLNEYVAFDVVKYSRFLDRSRGQPLLKAPKEDMEELMEYIDNNIGEAVFEKGYSFNTVFSRRTGLGKGDITGEDRLETSTKRLYYLYNLLLLQ
jgi:hypothetical protein